MMKRVFIISICIVTALMVLAGCAAATVAIPIALWLILWVYTALTGKKTVASADPYGDYDNKEDK